MLFALCLHYHSNTEVVFFACLSLGWATITGRLLGPKMKNSIKGALNPNFLNLIINREKFLL